MTALAGGSPGGSATSPGQLLRLIREREGLSRQQLMRATGMSRTTLYERLDALTRRGLLYEAEALEATGGRRSRRIRFDDRGRVVLALDVGHTHARVAVVEISGRERRARRAPLVIGLAADQVFEPLLDLGSDLLTERGDEVLVGIGVGFPAPVDSTSGLVSHQTTIPGWAPDTVVTAVARRWTQPLVVENDARASAVGECRGDETLVYVKVATGIGCGIVTDGVLQRGAHGAAGDIGHIIMDPGGPRCRCGRHGCLAAFSSGRALLQQLDAETLQTLDDLAGAAEEGSAPVLRALDQAGDQLGRALAATIATVNPHRLVLGGVVGRLPHLVDRVNARVRRDLAPRLAEQLVVEATSLGQTVGTRGLARLVVDRVYAPESVDATSDSSESTDSTDTNHSTAEPGPLR